MEGRVRRILESAGVHGYEAQAEAEVGSTGSDEDKDNPGEDDEDAPTSKLAQMTIRERPARVSKMICLGLGSPSADASGWRHIVLWQLVAFLAMSEICMYTRYSPVDTFLHLQS